MLSSNDSQNSGNHRTNVIKLFFRFPSSSSECNGSLCPRCRITAIVWIQIIPTSSLPHFSRQFCSLQKSKLLTVNCNINRSFLSIVSGHFMHSLIPHYASVCWNKHDYSWDTASAIESDRTGPFQTYEQYFYDASM